MKKLALKTSSFITSSLFLSLIISIHVGSAIAQRLAPGYGDTPFLLPDPGTYSLPSLGMAGDGMVLTDSGETVSLHSALGGNYALLSFMYASCADVNGCPLTAYVFYQLKRNMQVDSILADNLKLVSLSFDPARDTPSVIQKYAANFSITNSTGSWDFLTSSSETELIPILEAYNQDVQRKRFIDGSNTEELIHILRVFLIDPKKRIRNIYSVPYLHSEIIYRDLLTLLKNGEISPEKSREEMFLTQSTQLGPGDVREGYENKNFKSQSNPLKRKNNLTHSPKTTRTQSNLGLPPHRLDRDLKLEEKIYLGRRLFLDRRLSLNNTMSCAMCHIPEQGFTNNELATSVGIEGRTLNRNAPSLFNVGFSPNLFHDGREDSLSQQIWSPLLDKNEMGNPSVGYVLNKIRSIPDYPPLFFSAFGDSKISMEAIGDALASYQNSLNSGSSLFDRWYFGKEVDAFQPNQKRGFALFVGKAGCASCHVLGKEDALFSDYKMRNTGVGYLRSIPHKQKKQTVQLAPGVFTEVDYGIIKSVSGPIKPDLGLYAITQNPEDRWKFRTPTLRNIALTSPYMHDGSISTLKEVVEFYNGGGISNPLLDPLIQPLNLTQQEISDLTSFLDTLTGSNVRELVAEATNEVVGDVGI